MNLNTDRKSNSPIKYLCSGSIFNKAQLKKAKETF
jgi:hypothetical protein